MTAQRQSQTLSKQEAVELRRLFDQTKDSLTSCSVDELEYFSDLFARSLIGKADNPELQFAICE